MSGALYYQLRKNVNVDEVENHWPVHTVNSLLYYFYEHISLQYLTDNTALYDSMAVSHWQLSSFGHFLSFLLAPITHLLSGFLIHHPLSLISSFCPALSSPGLSSSMACHVCAPIGNGCHILRPVKYIPLSGSILLV